MLEIEAKLKVDSLDSIRERLASRGASFVYRVLEENHIFDTADGSLRSAGRGLRVRRCRTLAGESPADTMTFKGPRQPGPFKRREEINLRVDCGESACALLDGLGCVEIMRFEKRRETWELAGCEVALDEVPHLGFFVEIEGQDAESVRRVQRELGLQDAGHIPDSYISLLYEYCRGHGLDVRTIIFQSEQC